MPLKDHSLVMVWGVSLASFYSRWKWVL